MCILPIVSANCLLNLTNVAVLQAELCLRRTEQSRAPPTDEALVLCTRPKLHFLNGERLGTAQPSTVAIAALHGGQPEYAEYAMGNIMSSSDQTSCFFIALADLVYWVETVTIIGY